MRAAAGVLTYGALTLESSTISGNHVHRADQAQATSPAASARCTTRRSRRAGVERQQARFGTVPGPRGSVSGRVVDLSGTPGTAGSLIRDFHDQAETAPHRAQAACISSRRISNQAAADCDGRQQHDLFERRGKQRRARSAPSRNVTFADGEQHGRVQFRGYPAVCGGVFARGRPATTWRAPS